MTSQALSILIGTTKGAFIVRRAKGDGEANAWSVNGPFCDCWPINHMIGDPETGRLWAGGGGDWHGAGVWRSDDEGESWQLTRLTKGTKDEWAAIDPAFAETIGWSDESLPFEKDFSQVWALGFGHGSLYAGTKPANLLVSDDAGESWSRVDSLTNHPSAESWNPGAAGLTLHTIVFDPANRKKMWLGISAAGVFGTEDGGASWERRNRL